jgi:hypothetical protein
MVFEDWIDKYEFVQLLGAVYLRKECGMICFANNLLLSPRCRKPGGFPLNPPGFHLCSVKYTDAFRQQCTCCHLLKSTVRQSNGTSGSQKNDGTGSGGNPRFKRILMEQ